MYLNVELFIFQVEEKLPKHGSKSILSFEDACMTYEISLNYHHGGCIVEVYTFI